MKKLVIVLMLMSPLYAQAQDILTANFSDELDQVSVSLCFDGPAPSRLYRHKHAGEFSTGPFHEGVKLDVSARRTTLKLPHLPANTCIDWKTDIKAALEIGQYRFIMNTGNDLIMSANLWFWKGPMDREILVDIELPEEVSISTAWKEVKETPTKIRFRPDKTSADWEAKIALGQFEVQSINVPGANVRLASTGKLSFEQREKIRKWIEQTVLTVTSVYGYFPQPHPQVLVIPIGPRAEAVVTAHVTRGGGLAAVFYIDETRPLEEFMGDWTATHEFSHMLIPYISSRDRWLSEGLASYYQNVLRARDGRLSENQAWQKLYEGFQRGRKNTQGGSLAQATRSGSGSTMRVYWSGAAIMFMADKQLREASNNRQSLDTALQSLSACCMANGKTWRARQLFEQLDELTGTKILTSLYNRYVHQPRFPDMHSTWQELGINTNHRKLVISNSARLSHIRSAMMEGKNN